MRDVDEDDEFQPSVRIIPLDLLYVGLGFASRVAESVHETIDDLQHLVGGHINHLRDRDEFAESAALEIESLTHHEEDR